MSRRLIALAFAALAAVFVALGAWQLQRREGKLRLIARVEARLAAGPIAAPGPAAWRGIGDDQAYARVVATGRYRSGADTRVQAVTALGAGAWVLTPLETGRFAVLVNRGFVSADRRGALPPPGGTVTVRGLLRLSEPGGAFLRDNAPAADRWTSRDVAAIAARRGLAPPVAPYFIDADRGAGLPVGGLTVVRFVNNHLVYALTWFVLAILSAVVAWRTRARCDPDAG